MSKASGDLRARARRFENREHPTATHYPAAFREEVVALARERRALGVPATRIALELGVRSRTLLLWLRAPPQRQQVPKRHLRRVEVSPEVELSGSASASVASTFAVSVGAVRIEGLDFEGVVRLVRALA